MFIVFCDYRDGCIQNITVTKTYEEARQVFVKAIKEELKTTNKDFTEDCIENSSFYDEDTGVFIAMQETEFNKTIEL